MTNVNIGQLNEHLLLVNDKTFIMRANVPNRVPCFTGVHFYWISKLEMHS